MSEQLFTTLSLNTITSHELIENLHNYLANLRGQQKCQFYNLIAIRDTRSDLATLATIL